MLTVPADAPFEQEAIDKTGLQPEFLAKRGYDPFSTIKKLLNMYDEADIVCAHNGNRCDRPFLRAWKEKYEITNEASYPDDKLWIDTLTDIEYPKGWNKQLTCLAAYHNFLNPFPHQAIGDVLTMLKVLGYYPLEQVIESARTPMVAAKIVYVPFEEKEWPKSHGFFSHYVNNKFKFWLKTFKANKFEAEAELVKAAGYQLEMLPEIPEGVY